MEILLQNPSRRVTYAPDYDRDEDCTKIFHEIYEDGKLIASVDFTPYAEMSAVDLRLWFHLGCPNRAYFGLRSPIRSVHLHNFTTFRK